MKNIVRHLSLWNSLRALACTTLIYLITVQVNEALSYFDQATYFNEQKALISWAPSRGSVDYYLMEITDTQFFAGSGQKNGLTKICQVTTPLPFYQLTCEHNHSYQVRVKAVSPSGASSPYSETSILFMCDQKKPEIHFSSLPPSSNVQSPIFALTGSFDESNLDTITVNGVAATITAAEKHFESRVELIPGSNLITLKAWDLAGNFSTRNLEIAYSPLSSTDHNLSPFEVDYNNDGTKDLLVGTAEGMIALLTNTGTDTQPVFAGYDFLKVDGKTIDVGTHATPFIVDYNNDGIRDLLVGNGEGSLLYYANRGNTTHPSFAQPTTIYDVHGKRLAVDGYCKPCVVDWDDDNRKDILLGSGSGELVLYRNEGSDREPLFSPPTHIEVDGTKINFTSTAVPVVADWNNDGGKDLLVRNQEGECFLFLNEVVHGEPDLFRAEQFQMGDSEPGSSGLPVPIPFYWNGFGGESYLDGNSHRSLNQTL